jgi:hypothetical protein
VGLTRNYGGQWRTERSAFATGEEKTREIPWLFFVGTLHHKHHPRLRLACAPKAAWRMAFASPPCHVHEQFKMPVSVCTIVRALNDMKLTLNKVASRQRTESAGREAQA